MCVLHSFTFKIDMPWKDFCVWFYFQKGLSFLKANNKMSKPTQI